jgi:hypothetical protein
LRSGIGAPSSILGAAIFVGAFAALAALQFVILGINLNDSPGAVAKGDSKEAPMKVRKVIRSICETAWALGENVVGGLFLS